VLHDVLRGIKMATIAESQATPAAGVRSGLLPPISRDEPPEANNNNNNNSNNNNAISSVSVYIVHSFVYCKLSVVVVIRALQ